MTHHHLDKAIDRRGMLECMGWAGTGTLFALAGGIDASLTLDQALAATPGRAATEALPVKPFSFLQISDTHIGFKKEANPDVVGTLKETIDKVRQLVVQPDFIVHTGDITHLATPEQFDTAEQLLSELNLPIHFVPGEHDIVDGTDPRAFLDRFGKGAKGDGWYSFDANGAHFIALVNVVHLADRGMGSLGADQLAWLKDDVASLSASTPIVLLSHFPLWPLFPDWGWGTSDGAQALALLKRFASVTALNGHVHQIQQKTEGRMVFHTARSTAYPQPAPGVGPGPGPLVVPPAELRSAIGISNMLVRQSASPLAIIDRTLAE
ncbi:MAG: metallophosphoesterase [Erythrobacter sp.]|nr:metallophosphoesterase [Erythrobacter sp.]